MIDFTTLLLGLFVGARTVGVATSPDVVSVDVQIDGRLVQEIAVADAKASARVDFGQDLLPRRVQAIGRSKDGVRIAAAERWVNLPHGEVEAALLIEAKAPTPTSASIVYSTLSTDAPRLTSVTAILDGQMLDAGDPEKIELPPLPEQDLHLLRAILEFDNGQTIQLARFFGTGYTDEVDARLQPIRVRQLAEQPISREFLARCLPSDARVIAVEEDRPIIFFVRDLGSLAPLRKLLGLESSGPLPRNHQRRVNRLAPLRPGQELVQVWPLATSASREEVRVDTFRSSEPLVSRDVGMVGAFLQTFRIPQPQPQRLADAVAVAGLRAYASARPAAVVLLLGPETTDHSVFTADSVGGYLQALRIPFHVWEIGRQSTGSLWGGPIQLRTLSDLERNVAGLARELSEQRVAWVQGGYLPQEICLSSDCGCGSTTPIEVASRR